MYSPTITTKELELAQRAEDLAAAKEERKPLLFEPTSPEVSARYTSHLNSLINLDRWRDKFQLEFRDAQRQALYTSGADPLFPDERAWVRSEITYCTWDYLYFCLRHAYIQYHDYRGLALYAPNKAQRILNDVRAEIEEKYVGIFLVQLKGRQMGLSTDNAITEAHRVLFHDDTKALTASSKEDKTWEVAGKISLAIRNVPWFLMPSQFKLYESGETLFECERRRTKIRLQYGNQTGGIGRGETPTFAWITEIPDFLNAADDIQASLLKAMHNEPHLYFVAESTAKYKDDAWHKIWKEAAGYYHLGKTRLRPLFFLWCLADDIYPTLADVRAYMPGDYRPSDRALQQAAKCERFVNSDPLHMKYMQPTLPDGRKGEWKMPLQQMWFWEWDREQAEREKRLASWLSEVPSSPDEAFQNRGGGIFDAEKIADLRDRAESPLLVLGMTEASGALPVTQKFFLGSEVEPGLDPIRVRARWHRSDAYHYEYLLHPLRFHSTGADSLEGRICIWELPDEFEEYFIGEDCGEGVGGDFTCIYVWRKGDYLAQDPARRRDKVVACFYSNRTSAKASFHFLMCLGTLYSAPRGSKLQQPQLVIERAKGGAALIQEMVEAGWQNFYSSREIGTRPGSKSPSDYLGWDETQGKGLRDAMLGEFLDAIREDDVDIPCQFFIDHLSSFGVSKSGKLQGLAGRHDDAVIACGISYFAANIFRIRRHGETAEMRRQRREQERQATERARTYSPGDLALPVPARPTRNPQGGSY